jgi:hypothetical protein
VSLKKAFSSSSSFKELLSHQINIMLIWPGRYLTFLKLFTIKFEITIKTIFAANNKKRVKLDSSTVRKV